MSQFFDKFLDDHILRERNTLIYELQICNPLTGDIFNEKMEYDIAIPLWLNFDEDDDSFCNAIIHEVRTDSILSMIFQYQDENGYAIDSTPKTCYMFGVNNVIQLLINSGLDIMKMLILKRSELDRFYDTIHEEIAESFDDVDELDIGEIQPFIPIKYRTNKVNMYALDKWEENWKSNFSNPNIIASTIYLLCPNDYQKVNSYCDYRIEIDNFGNQKLFKVLKQYTVHDD